MKTKPWKCKGCGKTGTQVARSRPRKWCSEKCRRDTSYHRECVDCGTKLSSSDGHGPNAPIRCVKCATDAATIWTRDAIVLAIQEWADERGGIPPAAHDFQRGRARGDAVPCVNHVIHRFGSWNAGIRAAGFEPRGPGDHGHTPRLTPRERQECATRYAAGESSTNIAADMGCAPPTVIKWARHYGVPIRPAFDQIAA